MISGCHLGTVVKFMKQESSRFGLPVANMTFIQETGVPVPCETKDQTKMLFHDPAGFYGMKALSTRQLPRVSE